MRSNFDGVKFYGSYDMSFGANYEKAKTLLESLDKNKNYTDINEIIELYNVYQIMTAPDIKPEYTQLYSDKAKGAMNIVARFYKNINDSTLADHIYRKKL